MRVLNLFWLLVLSCTLTSCSSCQETVVRSRIPPSADPVRLAAQLAPKPVWPPNFKELIPVTKDAILEESSSVSGRYYVRYRTNEDYYKVTQFYIDELQRRGYTQAEDSNTFDTGDGIHYRNNDIKQPEFWVKVEKYPNCNRVIIKSALYVEYQKREQQKTTAETE